MTADAEGPSGEQLMGPDLADGEAWFAPLADPEPADGSVIVARVRFVGGAATRWHQHDGTQLITFTAGRGFVESRDEGVVVGEPGETVSATARTWHRHGALPGHDAEHVTVTWGDTVWSDPTR